MLIWLRLKIYIVKAIEEEQEDEEEDEDEEEEEEEEEDDDEQEEDESAVVMTREDENAIKARRIVSRNGKMPATQPVTMKQPAKKAKPQNQVPKTAATKEENKSASNSK